MDRAPVHSHNSGSNSLLNIILVVLLIITSVVASIYLTMRILGTSNTSRAVKGKQYQALFLTNNQVYFGHVAQVDNTYVKLTDIYYLQVQQTVQPGQQSNSSQQPNVSLAKLGGELHGPEDVMYVIQVCVEQPANSRLDHQLLQSTECIVEDFWYSNSSTDASQSELNPRRGARSRDGDVRLLDVVLSRTTLRLFDTEIL
jgi:flagellar basal body-associated protein FliL